MNSFIQDMKDLTDSKELMEAKPLPFLNWLLYLFLAFIIAFFIWAYHGKIEETVTAHGMIRPQAQILTTSMPYSGKITEFQVKEGQYVEAGDVLFLVDTTQLQEELEHSEKRLGDLQSEEESLIDLREQLGPDERDLYYKITTSIYENKAAQETLKSQIKEQQNDIEKSTVAAKKDGTIHYLADQNIKDNIEEGTEILNIIPEIDLFKVILFVSEEDITEFEIGDKVNLSVSSFPKNDYGYATGEIMSISSDAFSDEHEETAVYVLETSIDQKGLKNKDGEFQEFKIGMTCEGKFITETKSILKWMMEQLSG